VSAVDTEYAPCACSPVGKVKRVSQPYTGTGPRYWTVYEYDALGRTIRVTAADGKSATRYVYAGKTVTVADPADRPDKPVWKKYTPDIFGNLVKVTEPDPAGGEVDTLYTYTALNQLATVTMVRGGVTQTRTFTCNGGLLVSAANPENGTVNYEYNADRTLKAKTDAKGQRGVHLRCLPPDHAGEADRLGPELSRQLRVHRR
jgi:YD repeat-containing protein